MKVAMRASVSAGLAIAMVALSGCSHRWERPVRADGTYCYVLGKARNSVCTVQPVPPIEADQRAKLFKPDDQAFTLYVVRHRWADASERVPVTIDAGSEMLTVPESMLRIRLTPGSHRVSMAWEGKSKVETVEGRAGEVRFVQMAISAWSWGSTCEWDSSNAEDARARALKSRLLADVDMR
mgnify:CR=1 FL=1